MKKPTKKQNEWNEKMELNHIACRIQNILGPEVSAEKKLEVFALVQDMDIASQVLRRVLADTGRG